MGQLHKKFTTDQVVELLERYIDKKIERQHIQDIFGIKKRQFFNILNEYRADPGNFSIDYSRKSPKRISAETEKIIVKELKIDQKIIQDKNNPTQWYNYSYIRDRIEDKYKQKVSLPTIIDRAKKNDFYLQKKSKKKPTTVRS
jgi:signal recognition particle subunit SEC65